MSSPRVSVIVPVYNVELYLEQCIESVLHQSFADFELFLVDDGSTDASAEICVKYAAQDTRVVLISQRNSGLAAARNAALRYARGDYVLFLDSDDWLDLDTLDEVVRAADRAGADVVLWPYVREYSGRSLPKPIFAFEEREFSPCEVRDVLCRRMVGLLGPELRRPENADALVTATAKLYTRQLLENAEAVFVDIKIVGTEDALFNLQVFTHAQSAVYVNRFFYHYRRDNVESLTSRYKPFLVSQWAELHRRMSLHISEQKLGAEFEQALSNRVSLSVIGLGLNELNAPKLSESLKTLRNVLRARDYRASISKLELRWMAVHWRVFFWVARAGNPVPLVAMLMAMAKLRSWRNRAGRRHSHS